MFFSIWMLNYLKNNRFVFHQEQLRKIKSNFIIFQISNIIKNKI